MGVLNTPTPLSTQKQDPKTVSHMSQTEVSPNIGLRLNKILKILEPFCTSALITTQRYLFIY